MKTQSSTPTNYTLQDVQQAWNLLQQATKITLLTHDNPDADGVSACAALDHLCQTLGKQVEAIYPSKPENTIARQPANVLINKHEQMPDLIIACDTANYARMYFPEAFKHIPLINIDHHISNDIKGTVNLVNPQASSTCEDLFLIMQSWNPKLIDTYVAQCLMYGILYDSMIFQTQATTATTLRRAADLIDAGADLYQLKTELISDKNPGIIKLWGNILSNIQINADGTAAWIKVTQTDLKAAGVQLPALVGLNNFLSQICGIDVVAVFYEKEAGITKVSLRSKATDVNAIAKKFGGGGHTFASGISFNKPINEVIALVAPLL